MTSLEVKETVSAANSLLLLLLSTLPGKQVGLDYAMLRSQVGDISASLENRLRNGTLASDIAGVFILANKSGAAFRQTEAMRNEMLSLPITTLLGGAFIDFSVRLIMAQLGRIAARTIFVSRDDAEIYLNIIVAGFSVAIDAAADRGDVACYQSMLTLQAATIRDITERGRLLARVVNYNYQNSKPALVIANILYGDASRTDELISENHPVHPLFMPQSGRALSQ